MSLGPQALRVGGVEVRSSLIGDPRDSTAGLHSDRLLATQFRIACAEGSNSRDNSSGVRPAPTSSIIGSRNSGVHESGSISGLH
jgi:hypothetical protein